MRRCESSSNRTDDRVDRSLSACPGLGAVPVMGKVRPKVFSCARELKELVNRERVSPVGDICQDPFSLRNRRIVDQHLLIFSTSIEEIKFRLREKIK